MAREAPVLHVNLAVLTEKQLENVITEHCSFFGAVKDVTIYWSPNCPLARPFAMVSMETRGGTERLAAAFGERRIGRSVIVLLQHAADNWAQMNQQLLPAQDGSAALDRPGSQR